MDEDSDVSSSFDSISSMDSIEYTAMLDYLANTEGDGGFDMTSAMLAHLGTGNEYAALEAAMAVDDEALLASEGWAVVIEDRSAKRKAKIQKKQVATQYNARGATTPSPSGHKRGTKDSAGKKHSKNRSSPASSDRSTPNRPGSSHSTPGSHGKRDKARVKTTPLSMAQMKERYGSMHFVGAKDPASRLYDENDLIIVAPHPHLTTPDTLLASDPSSSSNQMHTAVEIVDVMEDPASRSSTATPVPLSSFLPASSFEYLSGSVQPQAITSETALHIPISSQSKQPLSSSSSNPHLVIVDVPLAHESNPDAMEQDVPVEASQPSETTARLIPISFHHSSSNPHAQSLDDDDDDSFDEDTASSDDLDTSNSATDDDEIDDSLDDMEDSAGSLTQAMDDYAEHCGAESDASTASDDTESVDSDLEESDDVDSVSSSAPTPSHIRPGSEMSSPFRKHDIRNPRASPKKQYQPPQKGERLTKQKSKMEKKKEKKRARDEIPFELHELETWNGLLRDFIQHSAMGMPMPFAPMGRVRRKQLHWLSEYYGLRSQSSGSGNRRYTSVFLTKRTVLPQLSESRVAIKMIFRGENPVTVAAQDTIHTESVQMEVEMNETVIVASTPKRGKSARAIEQQVQSKSASPKHLHSHKKRPGNAKQGSPLLKLHSRDGAKNKHRPRRQSALASTTVSRDSDSDDDGHRGLSFAHPTKRLVGAGASFIPESNIGHAMLKKLGWESGGLGKEQQGIEIPISAVVKANRKGLGS